MADTDKLGDLSSGKESLLSAVVEALSATTDIPSALSRVLSLVAGALALRTGWVWLTDPDIQEFYGAAAQNLPPYLQDPVRMTGASCWCIESFRQRKLTPANIDVMQCSRLTSAVGTEEKAATEGLRYHASIPLYFQDRPIGIMNVAAATWRKLTADELKILSSVAYQVGLAVERARLAEEKAKLARAEERTRIAREIHDTLAQGLAAIILHIEGALPHLETNPALARQRMEKALLAARSNMEEARRSVLDLRATPLDGKPLTEALRALTRSFASETGIRVTLDIAEPLDLPRHFETELYRIAQEALNNVRKHARATAVTIRLTFDSEQSPTPSLMERNSGPLTPNPAGTGPAWRGAKSVIRSGKEFVMLTIADNGVGFRRDGAARAGHGLIGMRERVKLVGGTIRISGRVGEGTRVVVKAALPQPGVDDATLPPATTAVGHGREVFP